jgi:glycosyltransferase involved in cell wall biosynthesis
LLKLARQCPEVPFLMVLNPRDDVLEREINAACPENVHMVPFVPFDLMPALFARASVFVSTSALEGFPNVFLQAVASGVPIGSLEVGSEFLSSSGGGECTAGDIERLANFVRRCWDSPESIPPPDPDYLSKHHHLEQQVLKLREVLVESTLQFSADA